MHNHVTSQMKMLEEVSEEHRVILDRGLGYKGKGLFQGVWGLSVSITRRV